MPGGPGRPPGSRNKLSEEFLRDLHVAWTTHGSAVLDRIITDRSEILFLAMTKLALVHPVEQSQPQDFDYRPRPREKVLEMLEQRAGPKARKMCERFLRGSTSWSVARKRLARLSKTRMTSLLAWIDRRHKPARFAVELLVQGWLALLPKRDLSQEQAFDVQVQA
jgi:hypothetical protein